MAKTVIPNGTSTEYVISSDYGEYILAADATMTVTGSDSAIYIANNYYGNQIEVFGTIDGTGGGATTGIRDGGINSIMTIGKNAEIMATHSGIYCAGLGATVINSGQIMADYGVNIGANGVTVINDGLIDADGAGVTAQTYKTSSVYNHAGGTIHGANVGVSLGSGGGVNTIENYGTISTDSDFAIRGSAGVDRIVNRGTIIGDVELKAADDTFVFRGGVLDGVVYGGTGNDTFIFGKSKISVIEYAGEGYDTMKAAHSYTLADYFEEGWLLGGKDLKLNGNNAGNILYGNKGDNVIHGNGGTDYITGARGDDRLFGGGASGDLTSDFFVFKARSGDDVIADFEDGLDKIFLNSYTGINSYNDIKSGIHQQGDDAVITLLNGDTITLLDTHKSDISAADFQF